MVVATVPSLRFSSDEEPGLRRIRRGRGFEYRDEAGARLRDEVMLARVRSLAIPPAWTDVWICTDSDGHLQATGRDAKRRKQYRYHPEWREFRDRVKFDRLVLFGSALPDIRRMMAADLALQGLPREKVIATIVRLLETTLVRVGNEEYARVNDAFGLTTLRHHHVDVGRGAIRLDFRGKGGRAHEIEAADRRVARIVSRCQELPGQQLFQYLDEDGTARAIRSQDVNDYLRNAARVDVTAKDYRTWMGTLLAASGLGRVDPLDGPGERAKVMQAAVVRVSEELGNTPAVCRASYIHPVVFQSFEDGSLRDRWQAPAPRSPARLVAEERRLLSLLRATTSRRRVRAVEAEGALVAA